MSRPAALLFIFCLFAGCSAPEKRFARLWFYTHANGTATASLTPASFLFLRNDGSYTRDIGYYEYGRWSLKEQVLVLTNYKNKVSLLQVKHFNKNEMELEMPDHTLADFESRPGTFATPGKNPFSRENNEWRIPPANKERTWQYGPG